MKIEFNQVTWYSKLLSAIVLLGALPVLIFYIGTEYQKTVDVYGQFGNVQIISTYPREKTATSTPKLYTSGVRGVVTVGPTCPVIQEGKEDECSDKPLATNLKFISSYGSVTFATSSAKGDFSVNLDTGTYTVKSANDSTLPSLAPVKVSVSQDQYTEVLLSFDSGIR